MRIFVFGSSLVSSYWNGAATYYRGIYKNLSALGHDITFAEPDIYDRQKNRDTGDFSYARSIVYHTPDDVESLLELAAEADLVIKHSGVGADDELLERAVLRCASAHTRVAFWDVDAPATLARVAQDSNDRFGKLVSHYDFVFTYGGGRPVVEHYLRLGSRNCHPIYNGFDAETHHPVPTDPELACDLVFLGHRLPDREHRFEHFFLRAAELAPEMQFILGGEGWGGKMLPMNVRWIGHVGTSDHNRVNCSARMVLNISRDSMANVGFSPATRVFEAAGAGACLVTDAWQGIETFFEPDREILVVKDAEAVVSYLRNITAERGREIGDNMRSRALADHTYKLRAQQVNAILKTKDGDGIDASDAIAGKLERETQLVTRD